MARLPTNIRHSDAAIRCTPEYRASAGNHPVRGDCSVLAVQRLSTPCRSAAGAQGIARIDCRFNPTFTIESLDVVLHPLEIVSIPIGQLGVWVGSLSDAGDQIIRAIDQLLSRAWQ